MNKSTIEQALEELKAGKIIVVCDDEDRENEGDLVCLAEFATPDVVNFMATHGRGLICLPMTGQDLDRLEIPQMVQKNTNPNRTAFCISIEAKGKTTTGISAKDRSTSILTAIHPDTLPADLVSPGHVFPLRAKEGGVVRRAGHTEAAVDLARMCGSFPAGVICEVMKDDGTMARMPDLEIFSKKHNLKIITVADLIEYRLQQETFVKAVASPKLPTPFGEFRVVVFNSELDHKEHLALTMGEWSEEDPVLVRVHSECLTGDALFSRRCDCGSQLEHAMQQIAEEGRGVLLYLRQEGRNIGLVEKLKAYELQDQGMDTVEANKKLGHKSDNRDYGVGCQILRYLGVRKMRILTNNPRKLVAVEGFGLEVVEMVPIEVEPTDDNRAYLTTKKEKLGHILKNV